LEKLFKLLTKTLSLEQLKAAFDLAEFNYQVEGDPFTAWGMAQGISRLSQSTPYMDERTQLDRAAGKVLRIAF